MTWGKNIWEHWLKHVVTVLFLTLCIFLFALWRWGSIHSMRLNLRGVVLVAEKVRSADPNNSSSDFVDWTVSIRNLSGSTINIERTISACECAQLAPESFQLKAFDSKDLTLRERRSTSQLNYRFVLVDTKNADHPITVKLQE
ncbi:hypothetical protein VN12_26470 [Pirellula sp. SH-Sr6A]|nr:hypothetical protein VN12_26470 [Pirellula sp. SH-Sr6A]